MNDPPGPRNRGYRASCLVNCPKSRHLEPIWPHIKRPGRGYPTRPFTPNKPRQARQDRQCKVGVSSRQFHLSLGTSPPPIPFRLAPTEHRGLSPDLARSTTRLPSHHPVLRFIPTKRNSVAPDPRDVVPSGACSPCSPTHLYTVLMIQHGPSLIQCAS